MSAHPRRSLGLVLLLAIVLSGCAQKRDLAEVADADTQRSVDVCALVAFGELKNRHPDLKFGHGPRLSVHPDVCRIGVAGIGTIALGPFGHQLPKAVREVGGEGVTEEETPSGLLISVAQQQQSTCSHHVVSNNGVRLSVTVPDANSDEQQDAACALGRDVAAMALERLASGIPTVKWPAGSLYTKDICAAVRQSGVIEALGIGTELQSDPSGRACEVDYDADGDFHMLSVNASVGWELGEATEPKDLTIADHSANYSPSLCKIGIDFGANDALVDRAARDVRDEGLRIEATPADGVDCQRLVDALEPLVEQLSAV